MASTNPITAITERLREIAKKRELEANANRPTRPTKSTKPLDPSPRRKGRRSHLH